jgi:aminoglycoside phosphotransferase (APT) family kinase protein
MESIDESAGPVRKGEHLEWAPLIAWLRHRLADCAIPGFDAGREPEIAQFPGGHSNLTYLLRFGTADVVVRRPPFGPVAPKAHDMAREFHWLAAMHQVFPLAPRPYVLCEDPGIAGSVFYAMERRHGIVVRAEEPPQIATAADRARVSEAVVATLARLHAVDVAAGQLSPLGKPAGFVARQVTGWTDRWHRAKTTPLAEMEELAEWLKQHLPADAVPPAVVHGDFKLDNLMFDPCDVGRIVAVLDWEMSALGDPLIDLGILLAYWVPGAPTGQRDALTTVTDRPGYFVRDEILDRYAGQSGRDLSNVRFYETFAVFKIAVVIQQIYFRYVQGQTNDARFAAFDARVAHLARQAATLASG